VAVAVLGNWEHWAGVDLVDLRDLYAKHGVRLLVNEQIRLDFGDRVLTVKGLDDFTAGRPDTGVASGDSNDSGDSADSGKRLSLLVQHSPGWFQSRSAEALKGRFTLCLAGHTHGGQVTLFGRPFWVPRGSGDFVAGHYDTRMCPLYVSRGIGTSLVPVRFGARPEIAVFGM
jgi:predicted MPP superfamily phosphohydrolase